MTTERKRWLSPMPEGCDICSTPFEEETFMIDGKTRYGTWGCMCVSCHLSVGCGLGTGLGQKYETEPPYYKVEG